MMALEISMNVLGIRWHGSASCLGSVNSSWILLPLVGSCNEQFIIDTDEINTTAQWHSMYHLINYLIHHPAPTISLPARARVWAAVWHNGVVRKSCSNKHKYLCNLHATPAIFCIDVGSFQTKSPLTHKWHCLIDAQLRQPCHETRVGIYSDLLPSYRHFVHRNVVCNFRIYWLLCNKLFE